jgi:hypothetical protein
MDSNKNLHFHRLHCGIRYTAVVSKKILSECHLDKEKERQKDLMLDTGSEYICVGKKLIFNAFKSSSRTFMVFVEAATSIDLFEGLRTQKSMQTTAS